MIAVIPPHHVFLGYCNGALLKKDCAYFSRKRLASIVVPVQKNGAIATGKQPDGRNITVIDLDVEEGKPALPFDLLDPVSRSTFVVQTPRGGLHVYFYTETEIDSAKLIAAKNPLVEHVDRRGLSGLIFAPGCTFANPEHAGKSYIIALDQPI
ncbi:MAG: hypothetical protein GYA24_21635, partial [Candidatus Lokiarchaeota archaeon]|nr:hypothetical protein [Candidatus Lokiarchaeota archaeon]